MKPQYLYQTLTDLAQDVFGRARHQFSLVFNSPSYSSKKHLCRAMYCSEASRSLGRGKGKAWKGTKSWGCGKSCLFEWVMEILQKWLNQFIPYNGSLPLDAKKIMKNDLRILLILLSKWIVQNWGSTSYFLLH